MGALQMVVKAVQHREEVSPKTTSRSGNGTSRVVVVDMDLATRTQIRTILQSVDSFKLAGDFTNADEALDHVPRLQPNLVLLGIRVPGLKDIEYIRRFKRIFIGLKIIIVTAAGNAELFESLLEAGAESCLVKPLTAGQCLATLKFASRCQTGNDPKPSQPAVDYSNSASWGGLLALSQREGDVLRGLAEGLLYKEIAAKLGISYSAVHKYQHRLFEKLHVSNRSEAISIWLHATADRSVVTHVPSNV